MIVVSLIVAFGYGFFGFIHLSGNMAQEAMFRSWGFSRHIMLAFGLCQVFGAIMLLAKPTRTLGGGLLMLVTLVIIFSNISTTTSSIKMLMAYVLLGVLLFLMRLMKS